MGVEGEIRTRTCTKCCETKPVNEFYYANKEHTRWQSWCKRCQKTNHAQHYALHREEIRQRRNKTARRWGVHTYQRQLSPLQNRRYIYQRICRRAFRAKGGYRAITLELLVGTSPENFYTHLCDTWQQRYGAPYLGEPCDIDHIVPVKTATDYTSLHKLFHYTNLQLLSPYDNRIKGCSTRLESPH